MMQQRPPSSLRGSSKEHCVVDVPNQSQHIAKNYTADEESDNIIHPRKNNWIHAIPVVVILCIFLLWCFSYPVSVEIKDFRIVAIHGIHSMPLNNTQVQLAAVVSALPPFALSPDHSLTMN
ncbi:hypothetical protein ACFE04_011583 [Oxalis oulophora]